MAIVICRPGNINSCYCWGGGVFGSVVLFSAGFGLISAVAWKL